MNIETEKASAEDSEIEAVRGKWKSWYVETETTPQNNIFLSEISSLITIMSSYEEPE
jgi:hypothetical protein